MSSGQDEALDRQVYVAGGYKPFGEFTARDAREQAAELRSVSGIGPTAKVVPVAQAWAELARLLEDGAATTVRDLDDETARKYAERVWVTRSLF